MALSVEQRVLLRLRSQLIHHLYPFTDIIVNRLQVLGLFTEITRQQILMSNHTSMQKCRTILDVMVRYGSQFFATFLQCLNDVGHGYMVHHLRETCIAIKQGSDKLPALKMGVSSSVKNHKRIDEDTNISSELNLNRKSRDSDEDIKVSETTLASQHEYNCSGCILSFSQVFQHMQDVLRHYNNHLREIERSISIMSTRSKCFSCIHCKTN